MAGPVSDRAHRPVLLLACLLACNALLLTGAITITACLVGQDAAGPLSLQRRCDRTHNLSAISHGCFRRQTQCEGQVSDRARRSVCLACFHCLCRYYKRRCQSCLTKCSQTCAFTTPVLTSTKMISWVYLHCQTKVSQQGTGWSSKRASKRACR